MLLLGSYNGQDSLGDKGLLLSVAAQLADRLGSECVFIAHVGNIEKGFQPQHIRFRSGAWGVMAPCFHASRWLRFWPALRYVFAFCLIPIWWGRKASNRRLWSRFWSDCRDCRALYFYGGTQLSTQWFDLNLPSILLTVLLFRLQRKPVFFGPQQYGPLTKRQSRWLRAILRWLVTDFRTRNQQCLQLLRAPNEKLALDEIYSCTRNYPIEAPSEKGEYLVVNYRGINFLDAYGSAEVEQFCQLVERVSRKLQVPIKVIQMSGPTFCDDAGIASVLGERGLDVELVPHTHDESDIVAIARNAVGAISMSFHGCVLTMLAGRPAVPVTSGGYYDHKYVDFDRYTGGQSVPLIALRDADAGVDESRVVEYFERFSPVTLGECRAKAAEGIDVWYESVITRITKRLAANS